MGSMSDSIYTHTAAFKGGRALPEGELRKLAPSIFSEDAHSSRSERFKHISTWEAIQALNKEGFSVVGARQTRIADPSKRNYAKHLLRMRRLNDGKVYSVGDNVFELLLCNANDGSACYELMGGIFRIACENSLVYLNSKQEHIKIYHKGKDTIDKVVESCLDVSKKADLVLEAPRLWGKVFLDHEEQVALADRMHAVRFRNLDGTVTTPIKPETMLIRRREEDKKDDLYTVFNVIQEAAMVGGLSGVGVGSNGRPRVITSRKIKSIDKEVDVNQEFWRIGSDMYDLVS